jgi:hypothetical protein
MKYSKRFLVTTIIAIGLATIIGMLTTACRKSATDNAEGAGRFAGNVIYQWAGEGIYSLNLRTAARSVFINHSNDLNGWDLSNDGKVLLTSKFIPGRTDATSYTLFNTAGAGSDTGDNSPDTPGHRIISQFEYKPVNGGSRTNYGKLSPDNTLIAILPTLKEGLVIINTRGEVIRHLDGINNEKISSATTLAWLPGNSLLLTHGRYLFRTDPPYTSPKLVLEMEHENWGNIQTDLSGKKITLMINGHIYLANADGTGLVQVTDSNTKEYMAVFSPGGDQLLVAANHQRFSYGNRCQMKIIPADGKLYHLDRDAKVNKPIVAHGEQSAADVSDHMYWR